MFYWAVSFLIFYQFLRYSFFTRHLASLRATDFDKRHWISTFASLLHHLPDTYISVPSLLLLKITSGRALSYARERKSSIRVCLPAIPIEGSIALAIREPRRPRARSCAFSTKLDGFNLERAPPRLSAAVLGTAASGIVRTYVNPRRADHPSGSKDPFSFGRQTVSKMDFLLFLSLDIYRVTVPLMLFVCVFGDKVLSQCHMISHVTCLGCPTFQFPRARFFSYEVYLDLDLGCLVGISKSLLSSDIYNTYL